MTFKRNHRKRHANGVTRDPAGVALTRIMLKCDCKLGRVVEYILAATQEEAVCNYCAHKIDGCGDLVSCAAATTEYLKERDGHA